MSGQTSGWVLRQGPKPDDLDRKGKRYGTRARGLRLVLLTIADAANADGEHAHPGTANIVEGSLYARSQALALVADLIAEGWLEVTEQGNGRGHATVYRVRTERRETVRLADTSAGGNRPVTEREPSDLEPGTVRSDAIAPHTQRTTNEVPTPTASPTERDPQLVKAEAVVRAHWDWCTANDQPTPTLLAKGNPFLALRNIVRGLLDAGYDEAEIAEALRVTIAFTTNALTVALRHHRERAGPPGMNAAQQALAQHRARRNAG